MKRKILVLLGLVAFLGVGVAGYVGAAEDTAAVTASVTPGLVALEISKDGGTIFSSAVTVDYGTVPFSTSDGERSTKTTTEDFNVKNAGTVAEDFTIRGGDAIDTVAALVNWTLDTTTVTVNQYVHQFRAPANTGSVVALDTTAAFLATNVAANDSSTTFDLIINMPLAASDSDPHDAPITVIATEN